MLKRILKPACVLLSGAIVAVSATGCGGKNEGQNDKSLPRAETTETMLAAMDSLWQQAAADSVDLHSVMVVKDGQVIYEDWRNGGHPDSLHVLYSVSKTFTSLAVGMAIDDSLLRIDEKIVDIFPDYLPDSVSDNLAAVTVEDLLTMSAGHASGPNLYTDIMRLTEEDSTMSWVRQYLSYPVEYEPGTVFSYSSMGTYMLSAAVQARTGKKLIDYLTPRLFEPLGIEGAVWTESPEGVNTGGWGLMLKTEDLAKAGQLMLNHGEWNGKQIVPAEWIDAMSQRHISSVQGTPNSVEYVPTDEEFITSDWVQGYGYQVWRCRHNAYRADGSFGQFIVVMPDQNAVVAMTAGSHTYQKELNLVWDYILPQIK